MSKKILVTGASGNVGSELVRQLAAAGHQVRAFVHDEPADPGLRNTDWVLVARDPGVLQRDAIRRASSAITPIPGLQAWTDDYNNLFSVLKGAPPGPAQPGPFG